MKTVTLYEYSYDLGSMIVIGHIKYDGNDIVIDHQSKNNEYDDLFKNLLEYPISVYNPELDDHTEYTADDHPEEWLQNLHKVFSNPDLLASSVQEDDDEDDIKIEVDE